MHTSALHPLQQLSDVELSAAIDVALERAARVSPPRSTVEAELQAGALRQLARARDEAHRRSRAAAGLPPFVRGDVSTVSTLRRAAARRGARAAPARPPSEDLVDKAIGRLEALSQRARDNLVAQGRDPGAARVTLTDWRAELNLRPAHFSALLTTLERRDLVAVDGAFASSTWRVAA